MTEGNGEVRELPQSWVWVQHKDIAEINPKLPSNELSNDLMVSFLSMSAVEDKSGQYSLSEIRQYEKVKKGYTPFINGDVIFAKITPCMENGKIAVMENLKNGIGFGSTEFHVSRLTSFTSRKYLFYYLVQEKVKRDARRNMTGSAGQLRLSKSYFEDIKIPLAPLIEQERIVKKIEELFSDIDQGIESLKTAQKQLKVYRQAVLKWAFEGKLTEEWRRDRQLNLKTGEALLAQIKTERENRYQQQLAEWEAAIKEWEAKGKVGKKPSRCQNSKCFSSLTQTESSGLPKLPNSWCWEKAGNIFDEINNGYTPAKEKLNPFNGEVPFLKVYNLTQNGSINFKDLTFIARETHELELTRSVVYPNDVLFNIVGPPLGKVSLVPMKYLEYNINQAVVFLRPNKYYLPKLLMYALLTKSVITWILSTGKATAGQTNLKVSSCREQPLPVCSIEEQEQIVQEIESRLSICDQLEATIIENLQKVEALRQSILKQAFEGKLVAQDPNDEPAEKLLERIKQEKVNQKAELKQKSITQLKIEGIPS